MSVQQREKNLAELDKRYPGIKQLVEDRRDALLAEEKCAVTEERSYIGETILKVRMEGKELYLAGKRNPIGPVANQLNLLGKIVPNAPVLIVGMGNIRYLEEVLSRTDASVLVLLYEPSGRDQCGRFRIGYAHSACEGSDPVNEKLLSAQLRNLLCGKAARFLQAYEKTDRAVCDQSEYDDKVCRGCC